MPDYRHYVPFLKAKEGEFAALHELPAATKKKFTPLFEIPPIPLDHESETPAKTFDQHISKTPLKIEKAWGKGRPLFLDAVWVQDERGSGNTHPLTALLDKMRTKDLHVIPVTGLKRDAAYQQAVRAAAHRDNNGVCLRLETQDFDGDLDKEIPAWLDTVCQEPTTADVILDLRELLPDQIPAMAIACIAMINSLPRLRTWRTLTVAGSGFPENLSAIQSASSAAIPRAEWMLWTSLMARLEKLKRLPAFGDYAIAHPLFTDIDPRLMRMSANLRYTADADWLIFKGRNVRDHGHDQFNDLCRTLVRRREFKGERFSWGDAYIKHCAQGQDGPGNATTWRKVGTNHHLTVVVDQLANVSATVAAA
jgi:hypothetical protein